MGIGFINWITSAQFIGGDDASAIPFSPEAVVFEGDTYLIKGGALDGAADSFLGWFSMWIDVNGLNNVSQEIIRSFGQRVRICRLSTNRFFISVGNGTVAFNFQTQSTHVNADGMAHFCGSWNTNFAAGLKQGQLFKNGLSDFEVSADAGVAALTDFTESNWGIGASWNGINIFSGLMKEVMLGQGEQPDWSDPDQLAKVYKNGNPVDPGEDGSLVTGTAPIIYLSVRDGEPASAFAVNRGSGGSFA